MSDDEGDGLSAPILDMPALGASYSSDQPEMAITFIGDGSQAPAPPQRAPAARAAAPAAAPPVPLTPQQLPQLQYQQRLAQARQIDAATLKTWTTVYPRYLEEGVSAAQGRRLPRSKVAGCAWGRQWQQRRAVSSAPSSPTHPSPLGLARNAHLTPPLCRQGHQRD